MTTYRNQIAWLIVALGWALMLWIGM